MSQAVVRGKLKGPYIGREQRAPTKPTAWTTARASRKARQLALGYWLERHMENGRIASYAEAAETLGVSRPRIAQLVGLTLLPVRIQEEFLSESDRS